MAEFVYNNNEHAAIKINLFYALYGDHLSFIIRNKTPGVELIEEIRKIMRKYYNHRY
jgi:hypothetical protein